MAKLTVQFSNKLRKMIKERATRKGISQVELLRRAIALYLYIDDETSDGSKRVSIISTKGDKVIKDIVFM